MTPAQLAAVNAEHSHQRALFAWANMAERHGFDWAWNEAAYTSQPPPMSSPIPELRWLHAIPNGGYRDKVTAGKLKAEGVKRGIPDVFLPLPLMNFTSDPTKGINSYAGLYVELKRPETTKAGKRKAVVIDQAAGQTSDLQDEAIGYLRRVGYAVSVCFAWDQAAKEIQSYIEASRKNA